MSNIEDERRTLLSLVNRLPYAPPAHEEAGDCKLTRATRAAMRADTVRNRVAIDGEGDTGGTDSKWMNECLLCPENGSHL
jgi:hypothetical protein